MLHFRLLEAFGTSTLVVAAAPFFCGCKEEAPTPVTRARSEAVVAAPGIAPRDKTPTPATPDQPEEAPKGPLCSSSPTIKVPPMEVLGRGSQATPFPPGTPGGKGRTWINLWAAWCEPCKKEIPLLHQFKKKLEQAGTSIELDFVSIDDDPRQLARFLDAQPSSDGLKQTYFLPEGESRQEWLTAVGLEEDPRLPVHLLVDAEGTIFCRIDGSIESDDFAAIQSAFAGR